VRVLAWRRTSACPQLPDVPTIHEAPGPSVLAINTLYAAYAPAARRADHRQLNAAFNKALTRPNRVARAKELAIELIATISTPQSPRSSMMTRCVLGSPHQCIGAAKPNDLTSCHPDRSRAIEASGGTYSASLQEEVPRLPAPWAAALGILEYIGQMEYRLTSLPQG